MEETHGICVGCFVKELFVVGVFEKGCGEWDEVVSKVDDVVLTWLLVF